MDQVFDFEDIDREERERIMMEHNLENKYIDEKYTSYLPSPMRLYVGYKEKLDK